MKNKKQYFYLVFFTFFTFFTDVDAKEKKCPKGYNCSYAFALFGKPKYQDNFKHFSYVNPNAKKGGKIKYSAIGSFNSLNPYVLKGEAAVGIGMVYDSLLVSSQDEPFSYYGLLSEYTGVAVDNSSVFFTINEDARWHNGKRVTAEDVKFSFDIITKNGHPIYKNYFRDVQKAEIISKDIIKFTFKNKENKELPFIIGTSLPIISKEFYKKNDFENSEHLIPLGNSAYKVAEYDAGKWIRYQRIDDYWAKNHPVNIGQNNFDIIQYDYYRDATVSVEAFKAGEYDIRNENIAKNWANEYNIKAVSDGRIIKEKIKHNIPTGMQSFVFNLRKEKFQNKDLRRAIGYAFDFEWINKSLFHNSYKRTNSFFSNSQFASKGKAKGEVFTTLRKYPNVDENVFNEFTLPKSDGSGNNRENLIKAINLLKKSGYEIESGKLINPNTKKQVEFQFLLNSPSFERVIAPFIKNLKILGIKADMRVVDSAQYIRKIEDFDFDIVVNVFSGPLAPGNEQFNYWHSSSADIKGSGNISGVKNPIVDDLVEKIIKAEDLQQLETLAKALDRVMLNEYIVVPNWNLGFFRIVHWNKFKKPKISPTYGLGVNTWWIE